LDVVEALQEISNKGQVAYDFWRRKVCERLTDPAKQKYKGVKTPKQEHS
jgi:hypothetical protein